jgi:hypothetical protein
MAHARPWVSASRAGSHMHGNHEIFCGIPGGRVASGKFWSDIAEQRLCAFGGRVLIAVTTVRTVCPCVVGVVAVAARMFSEEQLEQLRSFPDIGRDDLIRYFTLTQADMAFVDPGRGRGPADRLGLAVQLRSPSSSGS